MSESDAEVVPELPSTTSIPDDEHHRLFASDRRRRLLDILDTESTVVDLTTAAQALAEHEAVTPTVSVDAVEEIAISLHHTHLPRLADAGVIKYDPESHRIDTCVHSR